MIILLGATGYVGQAFARQLRLRQADFIPLSRGDLDYTRFEILLEYLRRTKANFLINAAGYTGKPNVDACEVAKADTLQGNTLFPQTVAHACAAASIPWGHVSSGCIYAGAVVSVNGDSRVEKDLTKLDLRHLAEVTPQALQGFTEMDEPNFTFRQPPCSFYSGTKALGEEAIQGIGQNYIWRLRIPFDEFDNPRNYLTKIQSYSKVYDNINSISHRDDFVNACLDLWDLRAAFGIYNITNPGYVTTRQIVRKIQSILKPNRIFEFWANDEEFYRVAAKTPRSNCVMDVSKMLAAGVKIRSAEEAVDYSLHHWQKV